MCRAGHACRIDPPKSANTKEAIMANVNPKSQSKPATQAKPAAGKPKPKGK